MPQPGNWSFLRRLIVAARSAAGSRALCSIADAASRRGAAHAPWCALRSACPCPCRDGGAGSPLIPGAGLRLAASSNTGIYLLQPPLTAFQSKHNIPVEQWIGSNPDIADRLTRGLADVAIMEWWDGRPGYEARTWRKEPLVVIVAPGHPLSAKGCLNTGDLTGWPILGGEKGTGTGTLLEKVFGPLASELKSVEGLGSTEACQTRGLARGGHFARYGVGSPRRSGRRYAGRASRGRRNARKSPQGGLACVTQPNEAPAALFVSHLLASAPASVEQGVSS